MTDILGSGSTVPQFITGFNQTEFVEIQEGQSVFVVAEALYGTKNSE